MLGPSLLLLPEQLQELCLPLRVIAITSTTATTTSSTDTTPTRRSGSGATAALLHLLLLILLRYRVGWHDGTRPSHHTGHVHEGRLELNELLRVVQPDVGIPASLKETRSKQMSECDRKKGVRLTRDRRRRESGIPIRNYENILATGNNPGSPAGEYLWTPGYRTGHYPALFTLLYLIIHRVAFLSGHWKTSCTVRETSKIENKIESSQ